MLQENIQFYRELIGDLPDGVILHRRRRILFANDAAARLFGAQSPARLEGMDFLDVVHPDIRDKVVANMQDTAIDSQAGFLEQKLLRFDGATAWVDVRITAKIIDGERSAIVVMRDATQRRQASEELGKARERLQDAISNLADGFALWDAEDRLVICNEVFRGQYGDLPIMVAPGVKFEDLIRAGFLHTVKIDPAQLDQTVAERVTFHRNPQARFETKLPNGRVYLTAERHTGHGGIVTIRSDITEFRRTEQALRAAEARYRALFELSPQPMVVHRDGVYLRANAAAANVLKAESADAIVGRRISDFMGSEELARIADRAKRLQAGDQGDTAKFKMRRCDGELIDIESMVVSVELDDGAAFIAQFRDITEYQRNAERLARVERQLRDAIDSMADGFALWDADDRLVMFNEPFRKFCGEAKDIVAPGISFEEMNRAYLLRNKIFAPEDVQRGIDTWLKHHACPGVPFTCVLPNDDAYQIAEQRTRDGGTVSICTDISKLRRAGRAIQESEEHHRLLFDAAPYGVLVVQDGAIVQANHKAARIQGYSSPNEMVGKDAFARVLPADWDALRSRVQADLAGVKQAKPARLRIMRPDGTIVHVEGASTRFEYRGRPALLIHQADVTERVQAEEANRRLEDQLRQAEKLKSLGTLAEGVAHEFNNLLVPIIGLTELAIDSLPPEDPNAEMLKQVVAAGLRSRELIKRIHAFSRAKRGGGTSESVIVQDAIGASIEIVRPTIPMSIHLNYQSDSSCRPVAIEHDQLEQILVNLCSNARDAIGDHTGEITVRVYPTCVTEVRPAGRQALMPGDYVVLSVRDTGCGMDAATMERIFDPFFTTKEVGQGTGLGLAVIHGIVTARGGGTTVESEPGKGAEVCVYLPIAGTHAEPATTSAWPTEVSS